MTDVKQATRELMEALDHGYRVVCLHYACENFHDVTDRPVAVSAIGVTEIIDPSGQRESRVFSIASSAANDNVIEREKESLKRFFEYAKDRPDARWVHWNMNNATYGFSALISRYRFLFGEDPPPLFSSDRLYDLDSIVEARYGKSFAKHPKLRSLCSLNRYFMSFFKDGKDEAWAYGEANFGLCERSTAEKSHLIASILLDFRAGALRTANSVGIVPFAGEHLDAVKVVLTLGERFLYVERELAHRHGNRATLEVKDEYDSQDLLRALLALFFDDVRPEDYVAQYAGASSRIDFIVPEFELAIELKFARDSMDKKQLGDELLVDRQRYDQRKDVRHLVCLVFDHGGILRNPRGLEKDLSKEASIDSFAVTVKIYDR